MWKEVWRTGYATVQGDSEKLNYRYRERLEVELVHSEDLECMTAQERYERGRDAHEADDLDKAIAEYTIAIKLDSNYVKAYDQRGVAYNARGDSDLAILDFNKAIEFDPTESVYYNNLAWSYVNLGDYDQAIIEFNKAVEIEPGWCGNRGYAYAQLGNYDQAIADQTKAIELNPNSTRAYRRRGEAYKEIGENDKALADFQKHLELHPDAWDRATIEQLISELGGEVPIRERSSHFNGSDVESWVGHGITMTNPGAGGSGSGTENGCLVVIGEEGGATGYFIAPSKYYGDWRDYSQLKLDLWSSGGEYFTSRQGMHGDIFLASGSATAQRLLPHRPTDHWETFVIFLGDDGEWTFGGGATSINDVLVNVTDFQIRAEYGANALDECGLDNVELIK